MLKQINLKNKVALVTGAGKGIGKACAIALAQAGAKVIIISRTKSDLDKVSKIIKKTKGSSQSFVCDVTHISKFNTIVNSLKRLDILVNNAGASWGEPIEDYSELGWDKVMDTNVKGIFFLTQQLLPLLRESGNADNTSRVINIGSIDGIKTGTFDAFSYGPSKAAVHHLTRVLAARLIKDHIIVNAIAPGPFPTWMLSTGVGGGGDTDIDWSAVGQSNPSGRVGDAEDIAGLAIFLSSRAGAYTVGQTIACDGGAVASS